MNDPAEVLAANIARLRAVAEFDPDWSVHFGSIEALSADEAELWFWRFSTERLHQAGIGKASYLPVVYENLVNDPVQELRRIYRFCELFWSQEVESRVTPAQSGSSAPPWYKKIHSDPSMATKWHDLLSAEDKALVTRVCTGTCLEGWW